MVDPVTHTSSSFFEKTWHFGKDPVTKKRVQIYDPLYSAEQWAQLESQLQTALGADFVSFSWQDLQDKQTFSVVFLPDWSLDDPPVMIIGPKLALIDSTVNAWLLEVG